MATLNPFYMGSIWRRLIGALTIAVFALNTLLSPVGIVHAQELLNLPEPGVRVALSPIFAPPLLKGIKVYRNDPFRFDFILDKGDATETDDQLKTDSNRLIKYFLASLTVPEKDLWVNLSPYEKDRIVPEAFGQTEMGRDLLSQDYILKQITASVIYPEGKVGKEFWGKVYAEALKRYGTTDIPVDTFNKVWIIPEKATVYENKDAAFVVESKLKVLLEEDYLALEKNTPIKEQSTPAINKLGSDIVREVVIPILEKEVNEGKNFATLRQVYHSLILATWYKRKVKDSIMGQAYADQKKTAGIDIADKNEKDKIWQQYVEAFKKGAYNFIKEEYDSATQETIPKKYFSGGASLQIEKLFRETTDDAAIARHSVENERLIISRMLPERPDAPVIEKPPVSGILTQPLREGRIRSILSLPYGRLRAFGDNLIRRHLGWAISSLGIPATIVVHNASIHHGLKGVKLTEYSEVEPIIRDHVLDLTELMPTGVQDLVINEDPSLKLTGTRQVPYILNVDNILGKEAGELVGARIVSLIERGRTTKRFYLLSQGNEWLTLKNIYGVFGFKTGDEEMQFSPLVQRKAETYLDQMAARAGPSTRFVVVNPGVGKEFVRKDQEYRLDKVVFSTLQWQDYIRRALEHDPNLIVLVGGSTAPGNTFMPDQVAKIIAPFNGDPRVVDLFQFIDSDWKMLGAVLKDPRVLMQIGFDGGTVQHLSDKLNQFSLALFAEGIDSLKWGGINDTSWFYKKPVDREIEVDTIFAAYRAINDIKHNNVNGLAKEGNVDEMVALANTLFDRVEQLGTSTSDGRQFVINSIEEARAQLIAVLRDPDLQQFFKNEDSPGVITSNPIGVSLAYRQTNIYKFANIILSGERLRTLDNVAAADSTGAIKGGIDFNPEKLGLKMRNNSAEIKFNLNPAMLQRMQNSPGVTPVIINILPLDSLQKFLGVQS